MDEYLNWFAGLSCDFRTVEVVPVLKVVEVHRVEDACVSRKADCAENAITSIVVVVISVHRCVMSGDFVGIEVSVCLAPGLAGDVVWLFSGDVIKECLAIDAQRVEGHLVEPGTSGRIVGMKFAGGVERSFLPEAREMLNTERTCGA